MYKNIPEMLKKRVEKSPERAAHFTLNSKGKWEEHSWSEFYLSSAEIAEKLFYAGLLAGDNVALIAPTSLLWEYVQMGILIAGGAVVGIDPGEDPLNIEKNVEICSIKGIVIQDINFLEKLSKDTVNNFGFIIILDNNYDLKCSQNIFFLNQLERKSLPEIDIKPKSPATIIFTSGTTGEQKAVLYTHEQVLTACRSVINAFDDLSCETNLACWLPLANLFQRMINFCAIEIGAKNFFVEEPKKIAELIPVINPHIFIGVPRVFEKIYFGIQSEIDRKNKFVKAIINYSIQKGDIVSADRRNKKRTSFFTFYMYTILDLLILKKIRSIFGNNLKYMISGSAPMPLWLLEKFHALGFLVLEAYGISENIIPNSINTPQNFKLGTVGKPIPENIVKIAPDGEFCIKGPGLFSGYYGKNKSEPIFDDEGFFATGDFVSKDEEGYLVIEGRKSEVFKTSTGRKIAPAGIENVLKEISYVEQAVVFGAQKKFIVSILAVSKEFFDKKEIFSKEEILKKINGDIFFKTKNLPDYKKPAGFIVKFGEFRQEDFEMTSNLKLRRKVIEKNYQEEINKIYDFLDGDVFLAECMQIDNTVFIII
ncbi:MAG: long-chain fatty acid--CoA ligase [Desulfobacteraceae bacterium]